MVHMLFINWKAMVVAWQPDNIGRGIQLVPTIVIATARWHLDRISESVNRLIKLLHSNHWLISKITGILSAPRHNQLSNL